jgi:hypothetical protein
MTTRYVPPGGMQRHLVWFVGYLALIVSVVLAIRFAYASADTMLDGVIRASAAAVAAVVGCHGPAWMYRSVRLRAWSGALLAALSFAICLSVTLAGGIGTIAAGSDKSLASRANASATYENWRAELKSLRDKRSGLPTSRPTGTIESDLTAARTDRRWTSSSSCADATATASRLFCAEYARLQGELATAKERAVLDERIRDLTQKLETAPAVRAANPQADVIARLLHVGREDAEAWYALLFALAVEVAAMSVLLIAETTTREHRIENERTAVAHVSPSPIERAEERERTAEGGRVIDWMRERAVPAEETTATTLEALHADYEVWCMSKELQAMDADAFADAFDRLRELPEIAGNVRKLGSRYHGIALADAKIAKLPVTRRGH